MPNAASTGVIRRVADTPGLLRLEAANMGFAFSEHSGWLALMVYAYARGGASEAGTIAFVLLIPSIIVAPFGAAIGQRFRPNRFLPFSFAMLATASLFTAFAMRSTSAPLAYVGAGLVSALLALPRPAAQSLLPLLARSPHDLVAANVASSTVEQAGRCVGPVIAGLILAVWSPAAVFLAGGLVTAFCVTLTVGLPNVAAAHSGERVESPLAELLGGFRAVRRVKRIGWLVAALSLSSVCNGVIDVLAVAFAEARLNAGESATGWLMAAYGFGAVLGGIAGSGLVGGRRMTGYFCAAGLLIGIPFALLGGVSLLALALVLFALNGAGLALVALICNVALQRNTPTDSLTRVFGVVEAVHLLGVAVGSLLLARVIAAMPLGRGLAIIAIAVVIIDSGVLLRLERLGALDAPPSAERYERMAADAVFAPLGLPALERLATVADEFAYADGSVIVQEGTRGEEYFLLTSGTVHVAVAGQPVRQMGAGQAFGEIALLHDVARTATITAAGPVAGLTVSRDEFCQALDLNPISRGRAGELAERYLIEDSDRLQRPVADADERA